MAKAKLRYSVDFVDVCVVVSLDLIQNFGEDEEEIFFSSHVN